MYFKIFCCSIIVVLFSLNGHSQSQGKDMKVSGYVYDSTGTKPLYDALAYIVRLSDSSLLGFCRSRKDGYIEIGPFAKDTVLLNVMFPGRSSKEYLIVGTDNNKNIFIPEIQLNSEINDLPEVVILAYKEPMYFKGDTLVFAADSFNVIQHAVVEDLLKRLPGVSVSSDGKIVVNGTQMDRLFVDGDEFFGDDPSIALKNLDAQAIDKVKIYEQDNPLASSGNKENIIDLNLKEKAKNNYFGRSSIASDFDEFHIGEILFNRFIGDRKISIYAIGSTSPKSQFTRQEIEKYGLVNELNHTFEEDGSVSIDVRDPYSSAGFPKTLSTGIYYTDKLGKKKKAKITTNYSFNVFELNTYATASSQYFLQDSTYLSKDSVNHKYQNLRHRINLKYEQKIDSTKLLINRTFLTFNQNLSSNDVSTLFFDQSKDNWLATSFNNQRKIDDWEFKNILFCSFNFKKPRRLFTIQENFIVKTLSGKSNLYNTNYYFNQSILNDTIDQLKDISTHSLENRLRLKWHEPISFLMLKLTFDAMIENLNYNYTSYDRKSHPQELLPEFSSNFGAEIIDGEFESLLEFRSKLVLIQIGSKLKSSSIRYQELLYNSSGQYERTTVLPFTKLTYKLTKNDKIELSYFTSSKLPSVVHLQPLKNNTNPNVILLGNTDLVANYSHNFKIKYNFWSFSSGHNFSINAISRYIKNDFSQSTTVDEFGRLIDKTINTSGNNSNILNLNANLNIYKKKLFLQPNFRLSLLKNVNQVNGLENTTESNSYFGSLGMQAIFDSLTITFGGGINYTLPRYSLFPSNSQPFYTIGGELGFEWILGTRFELMSNLSYRNIQNEFSGFSFYYYIWDIGISYFLLKSRNLSLSLNVNDILNQNVNIRQLVVGNVITENTTSIISRYFHLKITYRFTKKSLN